MAHVVGCVTGAVGTAMGYMNDANVDPGSLITSGRAAKVDQRFQRKFAKIDYKVDRQNLHREDLRDLMQLTVSRMDMYNVVGALLLTFALEWVGENSVITDSRKHWPRWFFTVFIINCFTAAGYLVFSLWFSMHCSITSQSVGTRLLLSFARLSIPTKDAISQMKVKFYARPDIAAENDSEAEAEAAGAAGSGASAKGAVIGGAVAHRPSSASLRSAGAYEKNDSDSDFERHLRHWLREQGQWLSYDAYSRACMVIGMNHLLQALTYNVVATVWEMSQLTGIICVVLAKVLSFQLLRIDMGDNVLTTQDCRLGYSLEILPPVLSVFLLAIFPPNQEVDEGSYGWMSVLAVPVFLLHGGWLLFVRAQMQEGAVAKVSSLAKRNPSQYDFQTAGVAEYLDDSEDNDEGIRADFAAASDNGSNRVNDERRRVGSLRARPTFSTTAVHDDMDFLPGTFQTVKYLKVIRLEKSSPERLPAQAFDHKPAKVVQSFSLAVASCWFLAGALHVINAFWCPLGSSDSMIPQSPDSNLDHAVPLLNKAHQHPGNAGRAHSTSTSRSSTRVHPFMRRLSVSWPEPSALFMIDAILCSEPRLLFGTEFATYGAERLANDSLSPVLELAESRLSSMFCSAFGCSVLISPTDRDTTWKLAPIDVYAQPSPSLSLSDATVVPVPASWRLVDGAWDSCTQAHCNDAWLAGWDGVRVVVATLRRENSASAWELHQRFKVRPGVGGCYAGPSVCDNWRLGSYDSVKALRLGGGGRTLAILHGDGILDGWSLRTGALLGRWALGSEYTAMCHDGTSLLVTRQCAAGPILESAPLPPALREELRGVQSRVDRVPANVVPLSPLGMANLRR